MTQRIIYNADLMKIMNIFENITGTKLKDCFIDNNSLLVFVVQQNEIGKAIGRNGVNIRKMEYILKRKIKIVEFNPEITEFVKSLIMPLQAVDINVREKIVYIRGPDTKTRGMLIGRESQNLKNYEEIIKRYFDIEHIKVV